MDGSIIYPGQKAFPFDVPNEKVIDIFIDRKGTKWLTLKNHGFVTRTNASKRFESKPYLTRRMRGKSIASLTVDAAGLLWFSDVDDNLYVYNDSCDAFSSLSMAKMLSDNLPDNLPSFYYNDSDGRMWIINNQRLYESKVSDINPLQLTPLKLHTEIADKVTHLAEDQSNNIWICTNSNRIYKLDNGTSAFNAIKTNRTDIANYYIYPLRDGRIAIGTALRNPYIFNPETGQTTDIPLWDPMEMPNIVTGFYQLANNELLISTSGSGVHRYIIGDERTKKIDGLSCDEACAIEADDKGRIWISTLNGMCKYTPDDNAVVSYFASDGIGGNQFDSHSSGILKSGEIVFGGTHGLTVFNPTHPLDSRKVPLLFEDLRVYNQVVKPSDSSNISKVLSLSPEVYLNHDENSFVISFAALDYQGNEPLNFFYMLEGFDRNWIDLHSNREIYFSNIPPGKYTLRVKATNADGSIAEVENELIINISPSVWACWWMKLLYALLVTAIISAFYLVYRRIYKEKKAAKELEMAKEREEHLNDVNMRFFANISHEFRTPLTMMYAPLKQLSKNEHLSKEESSLFGTIQWSVNRMLRLVNQLMDFNKLENDALPLQVRQCDVVKLLKDTINVHLIGLSEKRIQLKSYCAEDTFIAPIDPDKFDKVITNLMSNALKYTPEDGAVEVTLDIESTEIVITVADNGVSIPDDKLDRIFERHFQVENHKNYGTGIGLYFSRKLMELHHGSIIAENILGGGVRFIVKFPSSDVYSTEEHATVDESDQIKKYPLDLNINSPEQSERQHLQTVMIVDDEPAIVNYLKQLLSDNYNIIYAYDADSALSIIRKEIPDIVLSDVAMPHKDGYVLCKEIKEDFTTSHIPVILVTAKTTTKEQIEGLNSDADAYVTKPFDPDYLLALVRTQLKNRDRLKVIVNSATSAQAIEEAIAEDPVVDFSEQDKTFMNDVYTLMENEISNEELNINAITEKLFVSRSKFYYKIKALTGETPNNFFKKYKLNRAAELLKTGKYNISEVTFMTGFKSLTVFSRNFKAQFGVTPRDYIKSSVTGNL